MTADSQWNKPRVAEPISAANPAHTATDNSITLAAAKPAIAIARQAAMVPVAPPASAAVSTGTARKPMSLQIGEQALNDRGTNASSNDGWWR